MITKNMIDAGVVALLSWSGGRTVREGDDGRVVTDIYEAMADQKQKDALIEYKEHYKNDGLRHSER